MKRMCVCTKDTYEKVAVQWRSLRLPAKVVTDRRSDVGWQCSRRKQASRRKQIDFDYRHPPCQKRSGVRLANKRHSPVQEPLGACQ